MILLLQPIIFKLIVSLDKVLEVFFSLKFYSKNIFLTDFALKIANMQYFNGGRIFFNKINVLFNEIFLSASFLNPRYYFYSGDGSVLSPGVVEPLAFVLFPFFIIGFINLLNNKKFNLLLFTVIFAFINYFISPQNILFLTPIAIIYFYISIRNIPKPLKKPIIFYSLFLITRLILI